MKVGVDVHGTITSDTGHFRNLLKQYVEHGHEVYIISGPPYEQIHNELIQLKFYSNIHYTHIISVVDFLKEWKVDMWQDSKGYWWCDDQTWWKSKSIICRQYEIDIMVDDKEQYKQYFTKELKTEFLLWRK